MAYQRLAFCQRQIETEPIRAVDVQLDAIQSLAMAAELTSYQCPPSPWRGRGLFVPVSHGFVNVVVVVGKQTDDHERWGVLSKRTSPGV